MKYVIIVMIISPCIFTGAYYMSGMSINQAIWAAILTYVGICIIAFIVGLCVIIHMILKNDVEKIKKAKEQASARKSI